MAFGCPALPSSPAGLHTGSSVLRGGRFAPRRRPVCSEKRIKKDLSHLKQEIEHFRPCIIDARNKVLAHNDVQTFLNDEVHGKFPKETPMGGCPPTNHENGRSCTAHRDLLSSDWVQRSLSFWRYSPEKETDNGSLYAPRIVAPVSGSTWNKL